MQIWPNNWPRKIFQKLFDLNFYMVQMRAPIFDFDLVQIWPKIFDRTFDLVKYETWTPIFDLNFDLVQILIKMFDLTFDLVQKVTIDQA